MQNDITENVQLKTTASLGQWLYGLFHGADKGEFRFISWHIEILSSFQMTAFEHFIACGSALIL